MTDRQVIKAQQNKKLELISLVYLMFFLLAVLSPSIITQDYFGVAQSTVEEMLIFLFGLAGLMTFLGYQRIMERRTIERDAAVDTADRVLKELQESYKYIGSINRHIEVLKSFVNKTSLSLVQTDAYRKDLLQSLVVNAAQCVRSHAALIRFVDLEKLRTEKEVIYEDVGARQLRVPNKELKKINDEGRSHAFYRNEDEREILLLPSDRKESGCKAFMLLDVASSDVGDVEISLVKVFVNQAELVYHSLVQHKTAGASTAGPLELIDVMTRVNIGEVS
jgi:hypothetical protein